MSEFMRTIDANGDLFLIGLCCLFLVLVLIKRYRS